MGKTAQTPGQPIMTSHIVCTAGVCGGKPRIDGTRIRVQDIFVWHELRGQTPEEIVAGFPQLSLADVHAALTFYFDNREFIHQHMKEAEDLAIAMRDANGPGLLDRLQLEIRGGSVSPG